ncbi:MAG TPA: phosphoribosylformylglycinamidine synthase subunit PurQ [Vicinamibacteria bacterium]|jgi:phosphoribosylformylglycinamidine synthase
MPRFAVLVFPGSNCEGDVLYALRHVLGQEAELVWHKETSLAGFDAALLPGGFAHGDYLRPGAIARFSPIMEPVLSMAEAGKPVIGICNGFQVLMEAGLLPGAMLRNKSLHYVCRYVDLRVENADTPLTNACTTGDMLRMPIGHADGNFYADPAELDGIENRRQVMLRYATPSGELSEDANPNGSANHIAGIVNERGNVVGLMPHLDRCYEPELGTDHGLRMFRSLISSVS